MSTISKYKFLVNFCTNRYHLLLRTGADAPDASAHPTELQVTQTPQDFSFGLTMRDTFYNADRATKAVGVVPMWTR